MVFNQENIRLACESYRLKEAMALLDAGWVQDGDVWISPRDGKRLPMDLALLKHHGIDAFWPMFTANALIGRILMGMRGGTGLSEQDFRIVTPSPGELVVILSDRASEFETEIRNTLENGQIPFTLHITVQKEDTTP